MFKKFLFGLIVSSIAILCGCMSEEPQQFENCDSAKTCILLSTDFNQEHYIWENWSFSTNRVDR